MTPIFADTFFFLALFGKDAHSRVAAETAFRELHGPLVTTAWVLTEVADAFSAATHRKLYVTLVQSLRAEGGAIIVDPTQELFNRGELLYAARLDKDWSLTDCISFVVMSEFHLTDALTGDHHFEQAGFRALLK